MRLMQYYVVSDITTGEQIDVLLRYDFTTAYVKALYYPNFKAGRWRVTRVIQKEINNED